jgi:hypothetical protein
MANTSHQVYPITFFSNQLVERLLVLSESRSPTPGLVPRPDVTSDSIAPPQMMPSRPELHVVPATPIDSATPLNRP